MTNRAPLLVPRTITLAVSLVASLQSCGETESAPQSVLPAADASVDEGGTPKVCVPQTCAQLGAKCGSAPDRCGGKIECGSCGPGEFCGGGGPNQCGSNPCSPKTCTQVSASCGYASDLCSKALDCGNCPAPLVCGGSGVPNQCGCNPKSCAALQATCGTAPDGCGGIVDCGACPAGQTCGGGGLNKCGNSPCGSKTCAQLGASCGVVSDQCGLALSCGTCPAAEVCGGLGKPNQCGCLSKTCGQLNASCGNVGNGCGAEIDCGGCPSGQSCGAQQPNQCANAGGSGGSAGAAGAAGAGGAAGSGGAAGAAGTGGLAPTADKIDLLLMVDNSRSQVDKQQLLAGAAPDLVNRLTNPLCVDPLGVVVQPQPASGTEPCPAGSHREFTPVRDIHLGVISSSLGGHGSDTCTPSGIGGYTPRMEDMAHLLSRAPSDPTQSIPTWQNKGFLYWDPGQQGTPPGESNSAALADQFSQIIRGAGEDGCGFESQLEAWYRFLVDPAPYEKIVPYDCASNLPSPTGQCRGPQGIDQILLSQRKDFLRPDSLVAILLLTDEDDCSIADTPEGYLVLQGYVDAAPYRMPRATSACASNPNSPDCKSCKEAAPTDPECAKGAYNDLEDSLNLRCYRQKQRFGVDYMNPRSRYVEALTKTTLAQGNINPLFCSTPSADGKSCLNKLRDPALLILAGVVGVPWQDIAVNPFDLSKGYKPAEQLNWNAILGDPDNNIEPSDPLMIESLDPRSGTNPFTGYALAAPSSNSPTANQINGHEFNNVTFNELQYACIFKLAQPRDCASTTEPCECKDNSNQSPLCQTETGQYGTIQYRAKTFPARRILSVLKDLGTQAVVASLCAENTTNAATADYGYRPAIAALVNRIKPLLK